jgi:LmbE family N-acetylglucosaminyl deacetylase
VVSPHLDDAVLSMGAAIARHTRRGGRATIVTVLAGDLGSTQEAGQWDRRGGYPDEGTAATARREEDRRACRVVRASWVHLPGRDDQYDRGVRLDELWTPVAELATEHDVVFLPGAPLEHDDHRAVAGGVLRALAPDTVVARYAEEPYLFWSGTDPDAWAAGAWHRHRASIVDVITKVRALRCYRTQLPLLASREVATSRDVGRLVVRLAARAIAGEWLDGGDESVI